MDQLQDLDTYSALGLTLPSTRTVMLANFLKAMSLHL